ncbi:hypothetical protein BJY52DRAFT_71789 [Lactarius psammicola]|nr:hypothetical protein BJY52DRAFT_71789 [Lactarius psammicola]
MRPLWPFLSAFLFSPLPIQTFASPPILRLPVPLVRTSILSAAGRLIDQKMNGWKTEFVHIRHFLVSTPSHSAITDLLPNHHLSTFRSALRHEYHTETCEPWNGCTRSSSYTARQCILLGSSSDPSLVHASFV